MSQATSTFKVGQLTRHIDALRPHPDNPRQDVDPANTKILELAQSIIKHGVLEPLVVTPDNEVICGHRRRCAARVAAELSGRQDLMTVPVVVKEIEASAILEVMLHENMQRESLSMLEEARAMKNIQDRKSLTIAELARLLDIDAKLVGQHLAILKLETEVQALYQSDELPLSAASDLLRVPAQAKQITYAGLLARRQITLKQLREKIQADVKAVNAAPKNGNFRKQMTERLGLDDRRPPTRQEAVDNLSRNLGRKISLHSVNLLLESICCACGMNGKGDVCRTCPLPRFINGIVGRAEV